MMKVLATLQRSVKLQHGRLLSIGVPTMGRTVPELEMHDHQTSGAGVARPEPHARTASQLVD